MLNARCFACPALFSAGFLLATISASAQPLVWSDEFDGPTVDPNVWTFGVGNDGFGNGELQYHTARSENAYIDNGELVIKAIRENYFGNDFTSARMVTHGRLAFKYGNLQARIKLPDVDNGLWPAFWLLGNNIGQNAWPGCGEVDIMEVGRRDAFLDGIVNRRISSGAFWDYQGSNANWGQYYDWGADLYNDYHILELEWNPYVLRTLIDGYQIWALDISDAESASLEEFHNPMFILMNLSVGGWNFVEITDPAQITAPFPAEMHVDWIRLYDNGFTELTLAEDTAETNNFGVYTDTTPVDNHVVYEDDVSLYLWNNLVSVVQTPYEGSEVWRFVGSAGNWFGMGVFSHLDRNMQNYSDGHIHLHMKTSSSAAFRIGIASSAAGEGWVSFPEGEDAFGLVRDGAWHEVVIPLNTFLNVDFHTINQLFMIAGDAPAANIDFSIDNVYWSPSVPRPTPEHGNFGILTEDPAHKTAGEYVIGANGEFFIWENSLLPTTEAPYEGNSSLSLTSAAGFGWFGMAFTPDIKYDLTAFRYPESLLHFALKTTANTTFRIGLRSGNIENVGQQWIKFETGNDPYGFVRDGQWHVIEVPMTEIAKTVDLSEVSLLFEALGVDGSISNLEIDDVCLLNGGAALGNSNLFAIGDLNCDGGVDAFDIDPFIAALLEPSGYASDYPDCDVNLADVNTSGTVDAFDIEPFVACVLNAGCP